MTASTEAWHSIGMRPAANSRTRLVTGSLGSSIPVSSRTVATQIVLLPDMTGYSIDSMMT